MAGRAGRAAAHKISFKGKPGTPVVLKPLILLGKSGASGTRTSPLSNGRSLSVRRFGYDPLEPRSNAEAARRRVHRKQQLGTVSYLLSTF